MSSGSGKAKKSKVVEQEVERALKGAEKDAEKAAKTVKKEIKKAEKAAGGTGARRARPARPSGRAPEAMVMSRHGSEMISRHGRGFSLGELGGAGIAPNLAARWGVMVDPRRRSVIEGNVSSLKGWHSHATSGAAKRELKAAEAEIEGAVEEIEKGAEAVVKEAAKAEKAVKKEAKRAGGAVKEKVEKKPRAKKK